MLTVVFNAAPLITACKFAVQGVLVIDHLLPACSMVIAPSVEEDVAILGASYPDGVVARERIARGGMQVMAVAERKWTRSLAGYALGDGERDSIELCGQEADVEALVTDDYLAFVAAIRQGLNAWILPDLVVELTARGGIALTIAEVILRTIRARYRAGVIELSLARLQEVKHRAESRGAGEGGDSTGGGASQGSGGQ